MNKKKLGIILLVIGVLIVIISLVSDIFGLSTMVGLPQGHGFGNHQIIALVIGLVLVGIGWFLKNK